MTEFTPVASLIGGIIIGIASLMLLLFQGRIAGISGIFGGLLQFKAADTFWRLAFVVGLLSGGLLLTWLRPESLVFQLDRSTAAVIVAGLLVGVGTRMGSGCTSGHGVCGLGRLSPRSMVAVGSFLTMGVITAILVDVLFGGSI